MSAAKGRKRIAPVTLAQIHEAIAHNLRVFGYPDVTASMVAEIHEAHAMGKRFPDLPHGIIGGFVEGQIKDNAELIAKATGAA